MKDCIFCKIIKEEIPSHTIYEDELIKVFLDINPSTNGDCLVVPKQHLIIIDAIDDALLTHIYKIIRELKQKLEINLNCKGLTIVQNNGYGQDIKHFHIHLTPRYENDELIHSFNKSILLNLEEVANLINH